MKETKDMKNIVILTFCIIIIIFLYKNKNKNLEHFQATTQATTPNWVNLGINNPTFDFYGYDCEEVIDRYHGICNDDDGTGPLIRQNCPETCNITSTTQATTQATTPATTQVSRTLPASIRSENELLTFLEGVEDIGLGNDSTTNYWRGRFSHKMNLQGIAAQALFWLVDFFWDQKV